MRVTWTSLLLLALIGTAAASSKGSYTYECIQAGVPGLPADNADCGKLKSKDACLSASVMTPKPTVESVNLIEESPKPIASCAWRRVDTRTGEIEDSFIQFYHRTSKSGYINLGRFSNGDSRYAPFCTMETEVALPTGASGYSVDFAMSVLTPDDYKPPPTLPNVFVISACSAGSPGSPSCEAEIALPTGAVPLFEYYDEVLTGYWFVITGTGPDQISAIVKNKFNKACDADRRRANRRLLAPAGPGPWARILSVDKTWIGGPYANRVGPFGSFGLFYAGLNIHQIKKMSTVRVELEVERGRRYSTEPVVAYVIEESKFGEYFGTCVGSCPTPVSLAVASCTATGKECKFTATSLDPSKMYLIVISKITIGFNPLAPPIFVEYEVDGIYGSAVAGRAASHPDSSNFADRQFHDPQMSFSGDFAMFGTSKYKIKTI